MGTIFNFNQNTSSDSGDFNFSQSPTAKKTAAPLINLNFGATPPTVARLTAPVVKAAGNAFSGIKNLGINASSGALNAWDNPLKANAPTTGIGSKGIDGMHPSDQNAQNDVPPAATKAYQTALKQHTDLITQLTNRIQQDQQNGQDTTQLQSTLQQLENSTPRLQDFVNPKETTGQTLGQVAQVGGGIAALALAPLTGGASEALDTGLEGADVAADAAENTATKAPSKVSQAIQTAKDIATSSGAKIGAVAGGTQGLGQSLQNKDSAGKVLENTAFGTAAGGLTGGATEYGGSQLGKMIDIDPETGMPKLKGSQTAQEKLTDLIQEKIAPKLSKGEIGSIFEEGRLKRGNDNFLFGKSADTVAPSEAVQQAAATIQKLIPGAEKMSDAELYTALKNKTTEIAQSLAEDMKNVAIKPKDTGKLVDDWTSVKKSQENEPMFDSFGGSKKAQANFEGYLKQATDWDITDENGKFKKPTPKSLNDVWEAAKDYDDSIKSNVKNATSASDPNLQWQKEMWLQNRSIMRGLLKDASSGLGSDAQQAFSDMTDMYSSKENILAKAPKPDVEGKPGILPRTAKGWAKLGAGTVATGIGSALGIEEIKKLASGD